MRALDYILRDWRYRIAASFVPSGSTVLDIGGFDGSFLKHVGGKITRGVCMDPLTTDRVDGTLEFIRGRAEGSLPFADSSFDVVTLLAVYEHLGSARESATAEIQRVLTPGGLAILTVPGALVDSILNVLLKMRLIDGMSLEEHDNFEPQSTVDIFRSKGFVLKRWMKFQAGLNNLFVFEKR